MGLNPGLCHTTGIINGRHSKAQAGLMILLQCIGPDLGPNCLHRSSADSRQKSSKADNS